MGRIALVGMDSSRQEWALVDTAQMALPQHLPPCLVLGLQLLQLLGSNKGRLELRHLHCLLLWVSHRVPWRFDPGQLQRVETAQDEHFWALLYSKPNRELQIADETLPARRLRRVAVVAHMVDPAAQLHKTTSVHPEDA